MEKLEKKKPAQKREPIVSEPNRRSILDVVNDNFKVAKRVVFVHRLIYIGEHTFEDIDMIAEVLEKNVKDVNQKTCCFEPLSGILLYFKNFFCHIIEGGEDPLITHLAWFLAENESNLKSVKLLVSVHHIHKRFLNDWLSYHGRPATRIDQIDPDSNLENAMIYIKNCAEKLYNFANAYVENHYKSLEKMPALNNEEEELTFQSESVITESRREGSSHKKRAMTSNDPYMEYLPEMKLINFLVNCKYLKDLTQFHKVYGKVVYRDSYEENIWPISCDFIPYNIFDKAEEPIADLPIKQEVQEVVQELDEEPVTT